MECAPKLHVHWPVYVSLLGLHLEMQVTLVHKRGRVSLSRSISAEGVPLTNKVAPDFGLKLLDSSKCFIMQPLMSVALSELERRQQEPEGITEEHSIHHFGLAQLLQFKNNSLRPSLCRVIFD